MIPFMDEIKKREKQRKQLAKKVFCELSPRAISLLLSIHYGLIHKTYAYPFNFLIPRIYNLPILKATMQLQLGPYNVPNIILLILIYIPNY